MLVTEPDRCAALRVAQRHLDLGSDIGHIGVESVAAAIGELIGAEHLVAPVSARACGLIPLLLITVREQIPYLHELLVDQDRSPYREDWHRSGRRRGRRG